ncbi:hypothetical protein Aperf_G00000092109 [Anoplocephala perfoliata]
MIVDHDLAFDADVFEARQLMTSTRPSGHIIDIQSRRPFPGEYGFHLDFEDKELAKDYKLFSDSKGKRILFVHRDKSFVIRSLFRLPLTPANLFIRVVPLFIAHARRNEAVYRCANHSYPLVTPSPDTSVLDPTGTASVSGASRSLICIQASQAQYCHLEGHLTVLLPLDRRQMAVGMKPPSPFRRRKHQTCENGSSKDENPPSSPAPDGPISPNIHSQSQSSATCSSSYPMGVAIEDLVCRIGCYTSCLGGHSKGAVELIVRLEELPMDPNQRPIVLGLDRVEVHCSATPARDIRIYVINSNAAAKKAARKASFATRSSPASAAPKDRRSGRRGLSTSPAVADTSKSKGRSKRRLALVEGNISERSSPEVDVGNDNNNGGNTGTVEKVIHITSSPTSSETVAATSESNSPAFIDLLIGDAKQRFYLVATKSKERALQLRLMDDSSAAFDGSRMSSSRFAAYRKECLRAQSIAAEAHSASMENCDPP